MNRIEEIQREIESVRSELNESFLQNDEFEEYYRKSTELDKLIEEYLERKQQVQTVSYTHLTLPTNSRV